MNNKGFTLIELLVVIAIIGALSSVILASLNSARSKGVDSAIKTNLNNMRAQAELYYTHNNTYSGVCSASGNYTIGKGVQAAMNAAGDGTALTNRCFDDATRWAAYVPVKTTSGSAWCVDNTGASKVIAVPYSGNSIAVCN